jgi:hypothetical protein
MNEELFGELHEQEEYGLFGKEHERQQLNIADVSGSYFEVDFGGHLKAQMIIEDGKLKVTAAMNGWGDPVDVSTVRFIL